MSRIDEALRQAADAGRLTAQPAAKPDTTTPKPDTNGLEGFLAGPRAEESTQRIVEARIAEPVVAHQGSFAAESERLVGQGNADAVVVEQYRHLAAVLHQAQVERGIKVVMLASAEAAEGKTLTAANLALTLSESYRRRVLLIDADLRRPSLGRLFGVSAVSGLSECLKSDAQEPLRLTSLSASLSLLPSGRADDDPMSGLTSGRMQQIIDQATASFDWVIIDTPPVALLTDAHLLSAMIDAAVLVIDAGATQCAAVQRAIESIGREKIVGVVLNRVEDAALEEAAYYQYYGYSGGTRRRRSYLTARPRDERAMVADGSGLSR
jgi:capsular exopolysaccharide synthesis family protein